MTSSTRPALLLLVLAAIATFSPACRAIEGIFKAGVGVGFFLAVIIVVLVLFGVSKLRG